MCPLTNANCQQVAIRKLTATQTICNISKTGQWQTTWQQAIPCDKQQAHWTPRRQAISKVRGQPKDTQSIDSTATANKQQDNRRPRDKQQDDPRSMRMQAVDKQPRDR